MVEGLGGLGSRGNKTPALSYEKRGKPDKRPV